MVDDDLDNLRMVQRYLQAKGLTVITTDSPFGVNALLREENPDVVILDVMMPALDGETVARFIRDSGDGLEPPIVFYSAIGESELRALAARVPGSASLPKTASLESLHAAVLEAASAQE
jgi:DNA-binding response OmpR family regulator